MVAEARAGVRTIDRENAIQILYWLDLSLTNRTGDMKKLKSPLTGFRLRCGDYKLFFNHMDENAIEITGVRHRREAYR